MNQFFKKLVVGVILFYQKFVSTLLHAAFGGSAYAGCRFYPTCSHYAADAVDHYGLRRGSWLAIKRIVRCNPLFPGGVDPI